jgi:outer membrane beta-barrel protein
MRLSPISLVCAAICASALPARGEELSSTPSVPAGVQGRLYTMSHRWEVGVGFLTAVNASLVDQAGGVLSITYHPTDSSDFGVELLANRTSFSDLSGQIRGSLPARSSALTGEPNTGDEISGVDQLRYGALAVARVAPIYGKVNLAGELAVHFQAYLLAGAGAAAFRHESLNLCASPGTSACAPGDFQTSTSVKPLGEAGAGMRFYLGQRWSLRAELRGFVFPATYLRNADLTQPGTGTPSRYLGFIATVGAGVSALF